MKSLRDKISFAGAEGSEQTKTGGFVKWIKRLGFAGFLFFLIKGLLWLIIPYIISRFFLTN